MCHHVNTLRSSICLHSRLTSAVTFRHDPCSTLRAPRFTTVRPSVLVLPTLVYKSHSQPAQTLLVGTYSLYLGSLLSGYRVIPLSLSLHFTR